jgi:sugar lactone lactonase YvrE
MTRRIVQAAAGNAAGGSNVAWDLSYAYFDPPDGLGWNLSAASYVQNFSVSAQDTDPRDVFFKPDGTKMYVLGLLGQDVNEYTLSTAWDISTASYTQNFSVSSEIIFPSGFFFKPDGTKMYVIGYSNDEVNEYTLSTAWDVSTASYVQNFSVSAQESVPLGIFFKPDGTKMYIIGNTDEVNEYTLSTAWDVSTASYDQVLSVYSQDDYPTGLFFKPDGTKMFIIGQGGDDVNEYTLSTAWDVSTASYEQNFSVSGQEASPTGLFFKPDGTRMYVIGNSGDNVNEYILGRLTVAAQETDPACLFFKPDGTKMYVSGYTGDNVNEYNLLTAWDISTASYEQNFSVSAQEANTRDIFFKPDGTKMYITGRSGDDVNEYTLSTAWDISTTSYVQSFSIAAQEANPTGLFFKPDGTKMYITGYSGDDVNEYTLSTAWNVSTASYVQTFSIAAQEANPSGIFFKSDGTKMYVIGYSGDEVNEYTLSTAWDVSTASYVQNFSVSAQDTAPLGIFFKPDGTQFWVIGTTTDSVFAYTIGIQS